MRYLYSSLVVLSVLCGSVLRSSAQMVGTQLYIPGQWLEIGQTNYGSFGATPPPAGYHPFPAGSNLAEVYDYGHDGWTVGAPPLMGDYTYPGSPFEGFAIQVGSTAQLNWAFTDNGAITGAGSLTGNNVSYVNSGGHLLGNWSGSCVGGQLQIRMETRVDTHASWVNVTAKLYNTGATALNNIYYLRTCDPDNDEAHGGSFTTHNKVVYQNDVDHRVMVKGVGETYGYAYLGLCTKDQRARAFVYTSWPIDFYITDLSSIYTSYAGYQYTPGVADDGDIAIGLEYYICTIPAHDSTFVSYAYTFLNADNGVDSAFPEPGIIVDGGTPVLPPAIGAPIYDTFFSCAHPGETVIPVDLSYAASSGIWTWAHWTWAPGAGLSTTAGTVVSITLGALSGVTTFTITGTDSLPGSTCTPGNHRVIYLTVVPCFGASANTPCLNQTLTLTALGDSIGATYQWYNPGGTIGGTTHTLNITPAVWADTGTWMIIRNLGGSLDTAYTHVTIYPLPTFVLTCNGDSLCSSTSTLDTMKLYCMPIAPTFTYSWTGPGGYASGLEFPYRTPYIAADTGWYHITVTDNNGCTDTGSVFARIIPPLPPPLITGIHHYCTGDVFVPLGITLAAGASPMWYPDSISTSGSSVAPVIDLSYVHTITVWASQVEGVCEGLRSSFTIVVDSTPAPSVLTSNTPICADSTLYLTVTNGLSGGSFQWSGPAGFNSTIPMPVINNAQAVNSGTYTVLYTMPTGCHSTANTVVVINPTPAPPVVTADSPCNNFTMHLWANGTAGSVYAWHGPSGFFYTGSSPVITPAVLGQNNGVYSVVATLGVCPSLPGFVNAKIFANPDAPKTYDTAYCQYTASIQLRADSTYDTASASMNFLTWYIGPSSASTVSEPYYPSTQNPGTFTWYVIQTTGRGCVSPRAPENIHVLDSPVFNIWQSSSFACQDSSVTLHYEGPAYDSLTYEWTIPAMGASIVGGTWETSQVSIKFDSLYHDTVGLYVWDHNWGIACHSSEQVTIKVIKMPTAHGYINPDVCQGDTVTIELTDRSDNAYTFAWNYMFGGNDNMVWSSSSTSGPYGVCWHTPGTKDVTIIPYTIEGCRGLTVHDTVKVHDLPDPIFNHGHGDKVCADDSVLFSCDKGDSANYKYHWSPDHFFNQNGHSSCWGRVEFGCDITLTITDEFNCVNSYSLWYDVNAECCKVSIPSAFSPNGDGHNDIFRPIYDGYHRFHIFRIQNRWGQTVFESTNNTMEWDGNYAGVPQDIGTYYYYLKYDCDGKTIEKRGDVILVR